MVGNQDVIAMTKGDKKMQLGIKVPTIKGYYFVFALRKKVKCLVAW